MPYFIFKNSSSGKYLFFQGFSTEGLEIWGDLFTAKEYLNNIASVKDVAKIRGPVNLEYIPNEEEMEIDDNRGCGHDCCGLDGECEI